MFSHLALVKYAQWTTVMGKHPLRPPQIQHPSVLSTAYQEGLSHFLQDARDTYTSSCFHRRRLYLHCSVWSQSPSFLGSITFCSLSFATNWSSPAACYSFRKRNLLTLTKSSNLQCCGYCWVTTLCFVIPQLRPPRALQGLLRGWGGGKDLVMLVLVYVIVVLRFACSHCTDFSSACQPMPGGQRTPLSRVQHVRTHASAAVRGCIVRQWAW